MIRNRDAPANRIAESSRRLMEQQNNEKAAALAAQVSRLKELSIDINAEVEDQNRLLNQMVRPIDGLCHERHSVCSTSIMLSGRSNGYCLWYAQ